MQKKPFLLLLIFFIVFPLTFVSAETLEFHAVLDEVNGEVYITRSGGKLEIAAMPGMKIFQGDTIRTGKGSSAKLNFGDGDETTLGEYTIVTISELSPFEEEEVGGFMILSKYSNKKVTVKQQSGTLWSKVKNLGTSGNRHKVKTSTAVMGVRGTLFLTEYDSNTGKTELTVFDGQVGIEQFNNEIIGSQWVVNPGEGLTTDYAEGEASPINFNEIFSRVDVNVAKEVVLDTIAAAEEKIAQAEQLLNELQVNLDQLDNAEEIALEALLLAARAQAQAKMAANVLQAASTSPIASQIEQSLGSNFIQEQQRVNELLEKAQNTRDEADRIAEELDIPEEVVNEVREEGQNMVDRIPEPAPQQPSESGGGTTTLPSNPVIQFVDENGNPVGDTIHLQLFEEKILRVNIQPQNAANQNFAVDSDNELIVTVEKLEDGRVLVKANDLLEFGEATITAKIGDIKAEVRVIVNSGYSFGADGPTTYLELLWAVPEDKLEQINYFRIFHATEKINNLNQFDLYEFGNNVNPIGGEHRKDDNICFEDYCVIEFDDETLYSSLDLKANNYFYMVGIDDDGESEPSILHVAEIYVPLPCNQDRCVNFKLIGIKPVWIIDGDYGIGVKYEIPGEHGRAIDFNELEIYDPDILAEIQLIDRNGNIYHLKNIDRTFYYLNLKEIVGIEAYLKEQEQELQEPVPSAYRLNLSSNAVEPEDISSEIEIEGNKIQLPGKVEDYLEAYIFKYDGDSHYELIAVVDADLMIDLGTAGQGTYEIRISHYDGYYIGRFEIQ